MAERFVEEQTRSRTLTDTHLLRKRSSGGMHTDVLKELVFGVGQVTLGEVSGKRDLVQEEKANL